MQMSNVRERTGVKGQTWTQNFLVRKQEGVLCLRRGVNHQGESRKPKGRLKTSKLASNPSHYENPGPHSSWGSPMALESYCEKNPALPTLDIPGATGHEVKGSSGFWF